MAKLYRPAAWIALSLFVVLAVLHVAALLRIIAPPVGVAFAAFPIVVFGQVVMIAGFNGGTFWGGGPRLSMSQKLRGGFAALRRIPFGWKLFGLPFWYLYIPATFFGRMFGVGGTVTERDGQLLLLNHGRVIRVLTEQQALAIRGDTFLAMSAIIAGFAFAHFVGLRYVIPNRAEILAEVGASA